MEPGFGITDYQSLVNTSNVLGVGAEALLEVAGGVVSLEKREIFQSAGRILRKARGGQFLNGLKQEWDQLREKGKIDEEIQNTSQHLDRLSELLEFVDNELPDSTRMEAVKKIFLIAAMDRQSDRRSLLPQQYLRITKGLSSGEILVLQACFQLSITKPIKGNDHAMAQAWLSHIVGISGLGTTDLVDLHEAALIEKNLLCPRYDGTRKGDRAHVYLTEHGRLTQLGFDLCSYLNKYEMLISEG